MLYKLRLLWGLLQARPATALPTCTAASCAGRAGQPGCPPWPSGGAPSATSASWLRPTRCALAHLTGHVLATVPSITSSCLEKNLQPSLPFSAPQSNTQSACHMLQAKIGAQQLTAFNCDFSPAEQSTVCLLHAIDSDQKHTSCSGQIANVFVCPLQSFGMRVFQLTAPQPVDEVLECLGDALSADQSKLPVIMGCSRLRNQDGGVSTTHHILGV